MARICVIGVGPGSAEYLLPMAREKAQECDQLWGSRRALRLFADLTEVPQVELGGRLSEYQERFRELADQQIGIVVAGDPGFYSLLSFVGRHFPKEKLEVVPGVSSVQYLFATLVTPWQEYQLVSFHGRDAGSLSELVAQYPKLALLTDRRMNPGEICRQLVATPWADRRVVVGENLSYSDEQITIATVADIAQLAEEREFGMSVVIIDEG